ncbi:MAG: carbohydrate porin [Alphaproteobacteria bacterium]|nr:carbohydrate porin [Alphaproteobacteria bacterium]
MKKILFVLLTLLSFPAFAEEVEKVSNFETLTKLPETYLNFKEKLHTQYGFDYRIRAGFMVQRAAPNGENTVFRDKYELEANWDVFSSDKYGSGSIQFLYEDINYSHIEASKLAPKVGVLAPMNDDASRREYFKKLTYTHSFTGKLSGVSLSVGQFLIGNFAKTKYNSRPASYFNNYSIQKNMTKAYPTGGVGGYITYSPLANLTFVAGLQKTTNYLPQNISLKKIEDNKWTNFVYASYSPKITDLGKTTITGLLYHSPKIKKYSGQFNKAFDKSSDGWLITIKQDIKKWTGLLKINGSTGNRVSLDQNYSAQLLYNDPFNRNPFDQFGIAFALNKVSNLNKKAVRSWESLIEGYLNIGFGDFVTITPDIQVYINPALTKKRNTVFVNSLQVKFYF